MEVFKHNLQILLKDLVATAILYTWAKNAYVMEARLKLPWKNCIKKERICQAIVNVLCLLDFFFVIIIVIFMVVIILVCEI